MSPMGTVAIFEALIHAIFKRKAINATNVATAVEVAVAIHLHSYIAKGPRFPVSSKYLITVQEYGKNQQDGQGS